VLSTLPPTNFSYRPYKPVGGVADAATASDRLLLQGLLLNSSNSTYSICCGFAVESTTNPQHLDLSRCCGFVEKLWICRKVVDLSKSCRNLSEKLWICRKAVDLLWIFAVDLLYNLLYSKSTTNRTCGV
jgi:hypothetical protein